MPCSKQGRGPRSRSIQGRKTPPTPRRVGWKPNSLASPGLAASGRAAFLVHIRVSTGCGAKITPERKCVFEPWLMPAGHSPALIEFRLGVGWNSGFGGTIGDAPCLPSTVPKLRASGSNQAAVMMTRSWYRQLPFGASCGCWPLGSERPCWRAAPNPRWSAEIPDCLAPVDRRRCNTIERRRS